MQGGILKGRGNDFVDFLVFEAWADRATKRVLVCRGLAAKTLAGLMYQDECLDPQGARLFQPEDLLPACKLHVQGEKVPLGNVVFLVQIYARNRTQLLSPDVAGGQILDYGEFPLVGVPEDGNPVGKCCPRVIAILTEIRLSRSTCPQ